MAWVNGQWLQKPQRRKMIEEYEESRRKIEATHGDKPTNWPEDVIKFWLPKQRELERLRRIDRCEDDTLLFAIEYFSDAKNPDNDGNWDGFDVTNREESPDFHKEIADIMNVVSNETVNAKIAVAAPRSHAKSSYLSKAFPVHEVVYRKRKYIVIISETPNVSKGNMSWIRDQMKYNEKLRADFGPLLSPKDQSNIQDNSESFIAWHTEGDRRRQVALLEAASTGQALRGRNWNGTRPDLVILDDLEDARPGGNASTPEQRAKLRDWFSQTVIPLGDPKNQRTAFVYMGTTVHFDALLMEVLHNNPDFESKIYRAIIDQPTNTELWEQLRSIYIERENPNRKADADAFYEANEAELLEGSRVLWPEVQPLYKLMKWKWTYGSKAFNTEYMNNPVDEENMIFNPEHFTYWDATQPNKRFPHEKYVISMGVDFAMGKQRGDYSAVSIIAKDRETDAIYVVESWGERLLPDAFIEKITEFVRQYEPDVIGAEAQAAQEFFVDTLKRQLSEFGYPAHTRVKKINQRSRKELRIEALLPDIENGGIRFSKKHHLLLEQFERYGQGANDDLPDSLEMSVSVAKRAKVRMTNKPNWM